LLADAARAAREIAALTDRIDVLVNNAGGMAKQKVVTTEGFEANFCSNHHLQAARRGRRRRYPMSTDCGKRARN
jgi:NAD(P)-dependent dehydrogenase (short-subunit alcohol dehydrogenase family)